MRLFRNGNIIICSGSYKWCYNARTSAYCFYVRTKIPLEFKICISAPLIKEINLLQNAGTKITSF